MGGGNSKSTKTETIKPTAQGQASLQSNQALRSPSKGPAKAPGPSSKPNFQDSEVMEDNMNSPIKMQGRVTSKPQNPHKLAHNPSEDDIVDHQTPGTLAKKSKQNMPAQGGAVRQPQLVNASPAMSSTKSPKPDPMQAQRQVDNQRQKQMEDDKIKQLQVIKEQQKAKKAAAAAAAVSSQKREPTIGSMRNDTNGQEIFAQHNSPQKHGVGLGYSNNKFTGGLDESEASGDFRGLDMQIQGQGMRRDESNDYLRSAVAAPMSANFKVVDYGQKSNQQAEMSYAQNGTMAVQSSGIHMGMMGQNNNKDDAQNRNIDMAELNELLGM